VAGADSPRHKIDGRSDDQGLFDQYDLFSQNSIVLSQIHMEQD
jgi:hypothetical protein